MAEVEYDDLVTDLVEVGGVIRDLGGELANAVADSGYSREEQIKGLIQAVVILADGEDDLLDMAANFLADGGVQ